MSAQLALGQVETIGLPTAIAAADAGAKSANVRLVGYELARGGGLVTVKFVGAVGAVKAAVAAAKVGATRAGMVRCSSVIARPSEQILALIYSSATVGLDRDEVVRFVRETADAAEAPEPQPEPAPAPESAPEPEPQPEPAEEQPEAAASAPDPAAEPAPDPEQTHDAPASTDAEVDEGEEK